MKIVSHYLQQIDGVAIYPIITLVIFLSMFIGISIWALKIGKKEIKGMSHLPFEDGVIIEQKTTTQ
jgi:cytochrome c oxidase cbb3-type subunit 3